MWARRVGAAAVVSALLHLSLALWLWSRRVPEVAPPAQPPPLTWFQTPLPRPTEDVRPPTPPTRPKKLKVKQEVVSQPSKPAAPEQPPPEGPAKPTETPVSGDTPRDRALTPRSDLEALAMTPVQSGGVTLHPGDEPTSEELAERGAREAQQRVGAWTKAELGKARADVGSFSPALAGLRSAFVDRLAPGREVDKEVARAIVDIIASPGAARYARTGSPYDPSSGWRREAEMPSQLSNTAVGSTAMGKQAQVMFEAGARLRDFGAGKASDELVTMLTVNHVTSTVELLQGSGVGAFDEWVLETAKATLAARGLGDGGLATRSSLWAFRGRVTYMRSTKDIEWSRDWPMLAALMATGLLVGRFDELTGKMEYVDLSHPKFEATAHLVLED